MCFSMCICICLGMCTCMCLCMLIYIYVCMYVCMCICMCLVNIHPCFTSFLGIRSLKLSGLQKPSFWQTVFLSPAESRGLWNGDNGAFAFHPRKQTLGSSDPRKRRKWRMALQQTHGLPKAGFLRPWISGGEIFALENPNLLIAALRA